MSTAGKIPKLLSAVRAGKMTHVILHPETAAQEGELVDLCRSAGLTIREDRNVELGQIFGVDQRALLPRGWNLRDKIAEKIGKIAPERLSRLRRRLGGNEIRLRLTDGSDD
jgi:hypothetical protein